VSETPGFGCRIGIESNCDDELIGARNHSATRLELCLDSLHHLVWRELRRSDMRDYEERWAHGPISSLGDPSAPYPRMSGTVSLTIRDSTQDDLTLLVRMASLFGHGETSGSVAGWIQPRWDFGLVAEEDGHPIGVAWWRRFERIRFDGEGSLVEREVYLAVDPEQRGQGIGGRLLDELILRAESDPTVSRLVGEVTRGDLELSRRVAEMLGRRGFTQDPVYPGGPRLWGREV
jgi:GNAT superfamily N-acetyltransferase